MKKLAMLMFGLVLGCSHVPTPTPTPAPVASAMTPLTEEVLYSLNLSIHKRCMDGRDPNNQFYQDFCFCTSNVIINNIREQNIGTIQDLRAKGRMIRPSEDSVKTCILEAFSLTVSSMNEEE